VVLSVVFHVHGVELPNELVVEVLKKLSSKVDVLNLRLVSLQLMELELRKNRALVCPGPGSV
jgi:hypothetical protein